MDSKELANKLDDLRMELIQIREAIDMAETAMEAFGEKENLRQQVIELRKKEAMLSARIREWNA